MSLVLPFERITAADRPRVGGKACALSLMAGTGATVPSGVCIAIDACRRYARRSGIADRIKLELSRNPNPGGVAMNKRTACTLAAAGILTMAVAALSGRDSARLRLHAAGPRRDGGRS